MNTIKGKEYSLLYKPDHCLKFLPRYNFKTFLDQLDLTENEILEYMPQNIQKMSSSHRRIKILIQTIYFGGNVAFITFCHHINFFKRILPGKWPMFLFKVIFLSSALLLGTELDLMIYQQQRKILYQNIRDEYQSYKFTGDILKLNPHIIIQDIHQLN